MRFLQVHLSSRGGGARSAIGYIQKGLCDIGHECTSVFENPRLEADLSDFVLLHGFEETKSREFEDLFLSLRRRGVPHAMMMHDYWPICRQTNLCRPHRGWIRCDDMSECDDEECGGPQGMHWPKLPADETLVCFSEQAAGHFLSLGWNVEVIPHGIDLDLFRPTTARRLEGPIRVLFADAWGESQAKGYFHWKWLGENLGGDFEFVEALGLVPHHRMPHFFAGGDCFLFLSIWDETFGLVLAEAMACGLPVISYAVGIAPEVIEDGVNGRLIDSGNPRDIVDALDWIARMSDGERRDVSEACRRTAEETFGLGRMASSYVGLAERLAGPKASSDEVSNVRLSINSRGMEYYG